MKAARAAWITGAVQTSNVLAALHYGIPPAGTMAHSYVSAFPSEQAAFRRGRTPVALHTAAPLRRG